MSASSINEVMQRYVRADYGNSSGLYFWNTTTRSYDPVSYMEITRRAFAFGNELATCGRGDDAVCFIACHSPYATLVAFFGAVSAGAIPMIFPMPRALGSQQALIDRIEYWQARFDGPCALVLEKEPQEKFHASITAKLQTLRLSESPLSECKTALQPALSRIPAGDDVAFYQTTSSSTGVHKAVAISHGNVLSNVRGIRAAANMDEGERMISWLPLFHDMGLVGAVLFSFCNAYPLFLMTPTQFIKRPLLWLKGMSEQRCTITTAPNFGYDYCSKLVSDKDAAQLELSCVKHFFIGAEPIRISTVRSFCQKLTPSGVRSSMIRPAYGLAESTIIATISRPDADARFIYLDPKTVGLGQKVNVLGTTSVGDSLPGDIEAESSVAVCTAGTAINGMQVSLADESGQKITKDGCAGEIVIQGESVAMGYVAGGRSQIDKFTDYKTHTGDMGIIMDGELFIIERIKNVIIRNGENFLVSAMEQGLADLLQISHENVAVFESNIHDPTSAIVVLIEKHAGLSPDQIDAVLGNLPKESFPVDIILLHRARVIPRTTSGKKRHFFCRRLYQSGELDFRQKIEVSPDKIAAASLRG